MGKLIEFGDITAPAYKLETVNAACSRMLNVYPELIEKGPRAGKTRARGIPGLKTFATLPDAPLRALLRIDAGNRLFAVAGTTVFEVFGNGTSIAQIGNVAASAHPAIMVTNGFQLAIASGGQAYLVDGGIPAGTVTPISFTDGTLLRAGSIDFLDSYFIANQIPIIDPITGVALSGRSVFLSNFAPDGGTWDAGDVKIKEGYPDNIARVFADNEQLWVFGFDSIEVWVNTGAVFPFERQNGVVLKYGCTAPYSVAGIAGRRFWLWNGAIYGAYGTTPERISDTGVEIAIQGYGDVSDAEGWCQMVGGRPFYFVSFPGAERTWGYDVNLKAWHERGFWSNGRYTRYRGRVGANAFGKELVGDYQSGNIYEVDPKTYTDAGGVPLRREVIAPYWTAMMQNIRHNQIVLDMDTGIGLPVAADQPGADPQVILRYSDNRGKNWSSDLQAPAGEVGEDYIRVIFNALGASRIGKTYSVVFTDPCPFSLESAYLNLGAPDD